MPYPLPLTRTEAYLAYKAGVVQLSDLKPSLAVPRNGIDEWLAYWTGLAADYPKKPTVNLFDKNKITVGVRVSTSNGGTYPQAGYAISSFTPVSPLTTYVLVCGTAAGGSFFSWYDSSKHYISGSGWQNKMAWKSPANARYIKFDFKESEKDIVQFEKAPLSPYSPYTNEPLILQEEEAYIAYLCGVINEYPEKCLRRVGAYLRYIISARWGRPDHPLNREELYLSLIKTQVIPSGDPSSDIVIDGTAKAPFQDVKMYGDTFQQTYTGKNLYNVAEVTTGAYVTKDDDGWITITRDNTSGSSTVYTGASTNNLALETSTQYKIFIEVKAVSGTGSLYITSTESTGTEGQFSSFQIINLASMTAGQTYTVAPYTKSSFSGISKGLRTFLQQTAGQGGSVTFRLSVCAYTTPTETFSYEPYTGGVPSPNPEYPQQIQTVTGEQTVSINGTNCPISLGSLELCKIGNYQDYIYKDGDDWKVHKATVSAIIDGSESWDTSGTNTFYVANIYSKIGNSIQSASTGEMYASHFTIADITSSNTLVGASLKVDAAHNVSNLRIRLQDMSGGTAGFRQMLSAKKPSIYARRLTPTDTTITDTNLIAQLDALVNGGAEDGTTYIKVNATDPNLPGLLYVEAPKYE